MKYFIVFILIFVSANANANCRSRAVAHKFEVSQGFPHGRPGYIIDHTCALANGGLDIIENMQYQTYEESRKKDKIENLPIGRTLFCNAKNSLPKRTVFNCKKRKLRK